jgi:hypothetical protein
MPNSNALAIREAAMIVDQCKSDVAALLNAPENEYTKIHAEASLNKLSARLHHLAGSVPAGADKPTEFEPITNFMGEPIVPAGILSADDLEPGEADRMAFVARVEKLEAEIETISPAGIINSYTTAEDQLVLRGVAKRAGVEDFEDAEITEAFIESIVAGIKEKRAAEALDAKVEAEIAALAQESEAQESEAQESEAQESEAQESESESGEAGKTKKKDKKRNG